MKREYMLDDVMAAISTPIGTGGIGIVRMSGAGCIALADSIFIGKKKLTEKATHTLSYGKITDGAGGEIIDEVQNGIIPSGGGQSAGRQIKNSRSRNARGNSGYDCVY